MGRVTSGIEFVIGNKIARNLAIGTLLGAIIVGSSEEASFFSRPEHRTPREYPCETSGAIGRIALSSSEVRVLTEGRTPADVGVLDNNNEYDPAYIKVMTDKDFETTVGVSLEKFENAEYKLETDQGWNAATHLQGGVQLEEGVAATIESRCTPFPQD